MQPITDPEKNKYPGEEDITPQYDEGNLTAEAGDLAAEANLGSGCGEDFESTGGPSFGEDPRSFSTFSDVC